MKPTQLAGEGYQLATEYQLGEPIRVYHTNKRQYIQSLGWGLAIIALLLFLPSLLYTGFRLDAPDVFIYSICTFIVVAVALILAIPILRAPNMTVYICTSGLIVLNRSASEAIRWERIERVAQKDINSSSIIYSTDTDEPDIILSKYISGLKELSEEIELKAQLAKYPEHNADLEHQFEQSKNGQAEQQKAGKSLYQVHKHYLAAKDPDEAHTLGEEYRLGETLGTYRSGLHSLLQITSLKHLSWVLFMVGVLILDPQHGIKPFWPTGCLVGLAFFIVFFVIPRIASRNVRLHIYTEGFLFIHNSLDIIHWKQIEKVVYSTGFFTSFCTFHLKNGGKLALSTYLEEQNEIKQVFDAKIQIKEVYPLKRNRDKYNGYKDIGRLAD